MIWIVEISKWPIPIRYIIAPAVKHCKRWTRERIASNTLIPESCFVEHNLLNTINYSINDFTY